MRKRGHPAAEQRAIAPGLTKAEWPPTDLRIGISGWTYAPWRGVFYPKGLPQNRELNFASREHNSIEINGSFYSLQRPSSYQAWHAQTPAGFIFSVKGPRFITHMKKLREVRTPLANFLAPASSLCAKSWDRSCGSSRRTSAGTRNVFANFSNCSRETPVPRPNYRKGTTPS